MKKLLLLLARLFAGRRSAHPFGQDPPVVDSAKRTWTEDLDTTNNATVEIAAREARRAGDAEASLDQWLRGPRSHSEKLDDVEPSTPAAAPAPIAHRSDAGQIGDEPRNATDGDQDEPGPVAEQHPQELVPSTAPAAQPTAAQEPSRLGPPAAREQSPIQEPMHLIDFSDGKVDVPAFLLRDTASAARTVDVASPLPSAAVEVVIERFAAAAPKVRHAVRTERVRVELPISSKGSTYRQPAPTAPFLPSGTAQAQTLASLLAAGALDPLDRIELARLVAHTLRSLHAADVVTSGVHFGSFAANLRPRPEVWFLDQGSCRPIGADPLDGTVPLRGLDEDRQDLAIIIADLLGLPTDAIPGLAAGQVRTLLRLHELANSSPGARPTASRWLHALTA